MANHRATGKKPKYGHEMAQRVRAAILGAFDAVEQKGKKLSEILGEELEKNPLKFMELASKLMPKEHAIEHSGTIHQTHEHRAVSEIDQRITEMFSEREDRDTTKTLPH